MNNIDILQIVQHLLLCCFDFLDGLRHVLSHLVASILNLFSNPCQLTQINSWLLNMTLILLRRLLVLKGVLGIDECLELLHSLF